VDKKKKSAKQGKGGYAKTTKVKMGLELGYKVRDLDLFTVTLPRGEERTKGCKRIRNHPTILRSIKEGQVWAPV